MTKVKQYQEHHYCDSDNCNKEVMLGDGASVTTSTTATTATTVTTTTVSASEIAYFSLILLGNVFA